MYPKTDKRRLFQLIEMYLEHKIDEATFCDDFIPSYDVELDHDTLSQKEHNAFCDLGRVASRFSEFEMDHNKYPGVYCTKGDLNRQVNTTKGRLREEFTELGESGELDWETPENGERTNLY